MSNVAIRIDTIVKEYDVYNRPLDLAIEMLLRKARHTKFRALDGVTFDVARGEVFGIIGANGAGKSTLLKIITGVLEPTSGRVTVNGRVTAILELGLGFNPEYSGRDNIYLSGLLYGMDKAEIDRKVDNIIAFSGLGEFIQRPVKTYSSGMHARLAFSIATAVDPEILIIDEALAAGDAGFVQKSLNRIRQMCLSGRTVLLVSHGTGLLAQLCSRVAWLERGRVRMVGPSIQVIQAYDLAAHQSTDEQSWIETVEDRLDSDERALATVAGTSNTVKPDAGLGSTALAAEDLTAPNAPLSPGDLFGRNRNAGQQIFRRGPVLISSVEMLNSAGQKTTRLALYEQACLRIKYRVEGALPEATLGVAIAVNNRLDLAPVAQYYTQNIRPFETRETYDASAERRAPARSGSIDILFPYVPFRKGDYLLSVGLLPNQPASWEFYEYRHLFYSLSVDDVGMDVGAPIFLDLKLKHYHDDDPLGQGSAEVGHVGQGDAPPAADIQASPRGLTARYAEPGQPLTLRSEIETICFQNGGYPDRWPRHEHCPACGERRLMPSFSKYGFAHEQCSDCGFVTVNPYPPDAILERLYNGYYYSNVRELFERPLLSGKGQATPFSAPDQTLKSIVERATAGQREGMWLDVGGGIGAFAHLIATMRPSWTVMLNEANAQSVKIAREAYGTRLRISSANLHALQKTGQLFDVISSVAVLEHIPDPLVFLQGYVSLLRPGGRLVTIIPHFTRLNAKVSQGSSPNVVPPFHVSLFNEASLKRMLSRIVGVDTISIEQSGPPAFNLIHHVDIGDKWDITIPTSADPVPRSLQVHPYTDLEVRMLNALASAESSVESYFADNDGRLFLTAYCMKRAD